MMFVLGAMTVLVCWWLFSSNDKPEDASSYHAAYSAYHDAQHMDYVQNELKKAGKMDPNYDWRCS